MRSSRLTWFSGRTSPDTVIVCGKGILSYYNLYVTRGKDITKRQPFPSQPEYCHDGYNLNWSMCGSFQPSRDFESRA